MYFIANLAESADNNPANTIITLAMLVVVVIFFYFFIIRPSKKQEKEATQMRNSLRVGDEITTIGGIIGKIVSIKDPTCIIETGRDGTRIRILKSAVKSVDVPAAATIAQPDEEKSEEEKAEEELSASENGDTKSEKGKSSKRKNKK